MNIKDVARVAGVSVATVSRVINQDKGVSEATIERVKKAIAETHYIPNTFGRNLRKTKSDMILVLFPTLSNPFYSTILKGIEDRAAELGYGILICVTHHDDAVEKKYLNMLRTKQVDGVISLYSTMAKKEINDLAVDFPFVQCCEYTDGAKVSYVMIDNKRAAEEATRYFIEKGHKNIGMISGNFYLSSEAQREEGYREALKSAGIPFRPEYIRKSNYRPESGMETCRELLELENPPTAILAVSDMLAIGAIRYLTSVGMEAGKGVEVIGFDNASIARFYVPSISTVAQPRYDLGTTSVDLIVEKIVSLRSITKKIILPHELIFRESTSGES